MPAAKTLNERDTKLVSWLGEAHAKEAELEVDLTAHIALTEKPAYKKRLQAHKPRSSPATSAATRSAWRSTSRPSSGGS